MKLEPKHLTSYYPFDIIIKTSYDNGKSFNKPKKLKAQDLDLLKREKVIIKSILFPLSSLTKEITINGKNFIPIKNLFELHHCGMRIKERLQCFSFNKNKIKYDDFNCAITDGENMFGYSNYGVFQAIDIDEYRDYTVINQLELLMKLFEWKFDVFGLIEAGLAEPVTEDFNPYK